MKGTRRRVRYSSRRTARRRNNARPIGHSVGRKVAADTSLWKCCNPDTSGGKWRRPLAITTIEPFADRSSQPRQHGLEHRPPAGHKRAHRTYAARPSIAFLPAVVIITRATSICRSPAFMGLRCAAASPSRINAANVSTLKPYARKVAPVQPCGPAAESNSSARRCSASTSGLFGMFAI
jgi:hypothetical protein